MDDEFFSTESPSQDISVKDEDCKEYWKTEAFDDIKGETNEDMKYEIDGENNLFNSLESDEFMNEFDEVRKLL